MPYKLVKRPWLHRRYNWWLQVADLVCLVPVLVLFGISQPDLWRSKFWQIGFDNGWNSNPNMVVYAAANYQPPPKVPFVWQKASTNYTVAISVLSLFVLLVRLVAFIMNYYYPIIALFVHLVMTTLWTVALYAQLGPDNADPRYPSPVVWYIKKPCSAIKKYGSGTVNLCHMAKGAFALTVLMVTVQLANMILAIVALLPNPRIDDAPDDDDADSISATPEKKRRGTPDIDGPPKGSFMNRIKHVAGFSSHHFTSNDEATRRGGDDDDDDATSTRGHGQLPFRQPQTPRTVPQGRGGSSSSSSSHNEEDKAQSSYEMHGMRSPSNVAAVESTVFTPRTLSFQQLNRK